MSTSVNDRSIASTQRYNQHHSQLIHSSSINRYRLNRYNWLGHNFVCQHQYASLVQLRRHVISMATSIGSTTSDNHSAMMMSHSNTQSRSVSDSNQQSHSVRKLTGSDYLTYLECLISMRTTDQAILDQVLIELQQLDLERNSQNFLLLCQCLLYSGQFDSVAALCRQLINKQIDLSSAITTTASTTTTTPYKNTESADVVIENADGVDIGQYGRRTSGQLLEKQASHSTDSRHDAISNDSGFKILFQQISSNRTINNPKLWCIFAKSLEFQRQYKDSQFAYEIASKLVTSINSAASSLKTETDDGIDLDKSSSKSKTQAQTQPQRFARMSNFRLANHELAKFYIRYLNDFKRAQSILSEYCTSISASSSSSSSLSNQTSMKATNSSIEVMFALTRGTLASNSQQLSNINKIISSIESYFYSHQNPSALYNQLARRALLKLSGSDTTSDQLLDTMDPASMMFQPSFRNECSADLLDPRRTEPSLTLAKSWLLVSEIYIENSDQHQPVDPSKLTPTTNITDKQLIDSIEQILDHEVTCWRSSGLWNNLGLLFLIRGKLVASISCLIKANELDPCNWRINFNLALASQQSGLMTRAIMFALSAKSYRVSNILSKCKKLKQPLDLTRGRDHFEPFIDRFIEICYDKLVI